MAAFTGWTNLSEATFVLPPGYRVRIFTNASTTAARKNGANELPFAGHPTLGTCHAWLEEGRTPGTDGVVVQECGAGLVPLHRSGGRLAFAAPPLIRDGPVDEQLVAHIAQSCASTDTTSSMTPGRTTDRAGSPSSLLTPMRCSDSFDKPSISAKRRTHVHRQQRLG
jgi:predicted PhzF superfamily epimerase YddE/YHI9